MEEDNKVLLEVTFSYREKNVAYMLVENEQEARDKLTASMARAPEFSIDSIKPSELSLQDLHELNSRQRKAALDSLVQDLAAQAEEIEPQQLN